MIAIKGHKLNQRQLNAITPVLNDLMRGKINAADLEQVSIDALQRAGCPLGYDTGFRPEMTLEQRAQNWIINGEVGLSSKAIWSHMMGVPDQDGYRLPQDADDFMRCRMLLELIPEWRPRLPEMAVHGWGKLVDSWDDISAMLDAELSSGKTLVSKTNRMIREAIGYV